MQRSFSRVLANARLVGAYKRLRAVVGLGRVVNWGSRLIFPAYSPRWMEVQGGAGQGLELHVLPRFELAYVRGDHEMVIQELLSAWLRPGEIFLDVGAHLGFLSLIAARLVGPGGNVLAFEPDPDNFARLVANIARNNMDWVQANFVAVCDRRGRVSFQRATRASSRMEGRVAGGEGLSNAEALTVEAITLDQHFSPRTGVVKVDVEGAELQVLGGAPRLLAEGNLRWIVEVHNEEIEAKVGTIFHDAGYRSSRVSALRSPSTADSTGTYLIAERDRRSSSAIQ